MRLFRIDLNYYRRSLASFLLYFCTIKPKNMKTTVFDVAKYILEQVGAMSTMKLQKLVYYCQAWSLVWDEKPLFDNEIQAWANGPVVADLYQFHKGMFAISSAHINFIKDNKLTAEQIDSIQIVLRDYAHKPAQWLIELTHMEEPWIEARQGLLPNERGSNIISHASMSEYYSSL